MLYADDHSHICSYQLHLARFEISYNNEVQGQRKCILNWNKNCESPTQKYDDTLLSTIANELWGKNILSESERTIPGFSELKYHELLFRAHPSFKSVAWFDFARFKWEDAGDTEYPGRILMFLDLRKVKLNENVNLTNDIYAVIQSTKQIDQLSQRKLGKDLKICRYWKMEQKYRIISVQCITGTSFVINNFNQTRNASIGDEVKMLEKVIEIKPIQTWRDIHSIARIRNNT